MSLTKEQQSALLEELQGMFVSAKLQVDDHTISINRQRKSESQTCLVVYIDGSIEGKNLGTVNDDTAEIARKVYRSRTTARYKQKEIKAIEKAWGKRAARKRFSKLHDKLTYLDCSFNTATSLVRQYAKLDGIKLLELGGEPV